MRDNFSRKSWQAHIFVIRLGEVKISNTHHTVPVTPTTMMASKLLLLPVVLSTIIATSSAAVCTPIDGKYYYNVEINVSSESANTCSAQEQIAIGTFLDKSFDSVVNAGVYAGPVDLQTGVCQLPQPYVQKCCSWNNKYCGSDAWCDAATSNCEGACQGSYIDPLATTTCLALWTTCSSSSQCCGNNVECFVHVDGWKGCERIGSGLIPGVKEPGCCSNDARTCSTTANEWCDFRAQNCKACGGTFIAGTPATPPPTSATQTLPPTPAPKSPPTPAPTPAPTRPPTLSPVRVCKSQYTSCYSSTECCSGYCGRKFMSYSTQCLPRFRRAGRNLESDNNNNNNVEDLVQQHMPQSQTELDAQLQSERVSSIPLDDIVNRQLVVKKNVYLFKGTGVCRLCTPDNNDRRDLQGISNDRKLVLSDFALIENDLKKSLDIFLTDELTKTFANDPTSCLYGATALQVSVQLSQATSLPTTTC